MKYLRIFNNNAALVCDDQGKELVITGNGIGFGKHKDDIVDETKIQRRFADANSAEFAEIRNVQPQTIEIATDVVHLIEKNSKINFSDYQYFVLVDHINFALQRCSDGIEFPDGTVRWNIKQLFPNEYQLASQAIHLIEKKMQLKLPDSEYIFMTYHILNAQHNNTKLQDTVKITQLISGIVEIVQYNYQIILDKESFNYNRFVGHLRSFMIKHIRGDCCQKQELDPLLLQVMQAKYPKETQTVERINTFLKKKADWDLNPDDQVYLILHIWRVTHRDEGV